MTYGRNGIINHTYIWAWFVPNKWELDRSVVNNDIGITVTLDLLKSRIWMVYGHHILSLVLSYMNTASNVLEAVMRRGDGQADIRTDVSNPAKNPAEYADPSGEKMRALTWQGKYNVQVGE